MIRTSDQINEISEALAKAQAKFGAAIKGSQNPAFRSKYADLSSIIEATLEHLNSEGIVAMQHPALVFEERGEDRLAMVIVTTRLQHKSGQWMESDLSVPAVQRERFDAQSVGSGITYACRYALQSICLVPREDDDGNAATGTGSREAAQAVAQKKIAEAKERAEETPPVGENAALFYVWFEESQTAEITGHKGLLKVNSDLLKRFWNATAKAIVVNAEQLEQLKFELERRGVTFRPLKAAQ